MPSYAEDVAQLVPASDDHALLRGILFGVAIGAVAVSLVLLGRAIEARKRDRQIPPANPFTPPSPQGGSPL
ncbi:MAG: hypothetical protein AB4911_23125 [Oscillochloridaceae bacterium umkhey_bin13]